MATILDELADSARVRVAQDKVRVPEEEMMIRAEAVFAEERFEAALASPGISFICEVKKASPSKGVIAVDFPYLGIAAEYEAAGADVISVLTEPTRFLGSDEYLEEIAAAVKIPVLRKDFVVDPYQLYQAKALGAAAALLIVSLLGDELPLYLETASALGLGTLTEVHDESEARLAVSAGAHVIGVNNRDLKTFDVDTSLTARLREFIPDGVLFVAESGIKTAEDVRLVREAGADAVLIGETLMRAEDKAAMLRELRS
ncbi:MAG: indole-3-glycerol phosphate synthase TrpC [Clostridiales Family XIII bacterium]|jgi:indole-3-glycerol phosphate synthase|nr:indole-3-glycerol phosphate synthase TrpC [Clostridiales Family XIII bacterium]